MLNQEIWDYAMTIAGKKSSSKKRSSSKKGSSYGGNTPIKSKKYILKPKGENITKSGNLMSLGIPSNKAVPYRGYHETFGQMRKRLGDVDALLLFSELLEEGGQHKTSKKVKKNPRKMAHTMDAEDHREEIQEKIEKQDEKIAVLEERLEENPNDMRAEEMLEKAMEKRDILYDDLDEIMAELEEMDFTGLGRKKILKGSTYKGSAKKSKKSSTKSMKGSARAGKTKKTSKSKKGSARAGKTSRSKNSKGKKSSKNLPKHKMSKRGSALLGGDRNGDRYRV